MSDTIKCAVTATRTLLAVSVCLGSAESLSALRVFSDAGLLAWKVQKTQNSFFLRSRLAPFLDRVFEFDGVRFLLSLRLFLCVLLALPGQPRILYAAIAAALFMITSLLNLRSPYGLEGSDQMELIVLAGLFVALALAESRWALLGLIFIAFESALSYFVSGVAKLFSYSWLHGEAIAKIVNSRTYGSRRVASLLGRKGVAASLICWATIAFEIFFPLTLIISFPFLLAYLIMGVIFHLIIALTMGLNKFVWAFVSSYPALCAVNLVLSTRLHKFHFMRIILHY